MRTPARLRTAAGAAALTALTALTGVGAAAAAAPAPQGPPTDLSDMVIDAPAGVACDFALRIEATGGMEVTAGSNGTVITVGKGYAFTFTNLEDPDRTLSTRSSGYARRTIPNGDGTYRVEATGHELVILFPSDDPPGPSTVVYTGRVVYTLEADESFTLISTVGRSLDVCAALA